MRAPCCKVVIFDLDGTLIDSGDFIFKTFQYALHPFGIVPTLSLIEKIRSRSQENLFQGLLDPEKADEAQKRIVEASILFASEVSIYPGVEESLKNFDSKGIQLGLWTGRDLSSTLHILNLLGLKSYFKYVVSGSCCANNKPNPSGLLRLIEYFSCDPSEVLMVGDHEHDIQGAKAAGVSSALMMWNRNKSFLNMNISPDYKFESISELCCLIE